MRFVVITGLSGAGKSEAMRAFEDMNYFCIDNLPPVLIPKFAELCAESQGRVQRVAIVSDVRGGEFFNSLFDGLEYLDQAGLAYEILFLEASDQALVRRFKESRRRHPLAADAGLLRGIGLEREKLAELRGRAHHVIDTSNLVPRDLRLEIERRLGNGSDIGRLRTTIVSFGFKHGTPIDADLLFDVRFLPNPHYVSDLRAHNGTDAEVADYVFRWPVTHHFYEKLTDMMSFLLPQYVREGKGVLVVGIGCTGGQHRSVALAERLGRHLSDLGYDIHLLHRDIRAERVNTSSVAP